MYQDKLNPFRQIQSKDPAVKVTGNNILIKPYYLNYRFASGVALIGVIVYALLAFDLDMLFTVIFVLLLIVSVIQTSIELKRYNTIIIDLAKKDLTACPNFFYRPFHSRSKWNFSEISRAYSVSNYYSGGFWLEYRRYYLVLVLKNGEEIKLLSSNKEDVAADITEKMTNVF